MSKDFFRGEIGHWEGVKFIELKGARRLSARDQRIFLGSMSVLLLVLAWTVLGPMAQLMSIVPLFVYWIIERRLQKQEVERFAEALAPESDMAPGAAASRMFADALFQEVKTPGFISAIRAIQAEKNMGASLMLKAIRRISIP